MERYMLKVLFHFGIRGSVEVLHYIKTGHINQIYEVIVSGKTYAVQALNTYVFPNSKGVMENLTDAGDCKKICKMIFLFACVWFVVFVQKY